MMYSPRCYARLLFVAACYAAIASAAMRRALAFFDSIGVMVMFLAPPRLPLHRPQSAH
jgi:hypothetical protein